MLDWISPSKEEEEKAVEREMRRELEALNDTPVELAVEVARDVYHREGATDLLLAGSPRPSSKAQIGKRERAAEEEHSTEPHGRAEGAKGTGAPVAHERVGPPRRERSTAFAKRSHQTECGPCWWSASAGK